MEYKTFYTMFLAEMPWRVPGSNNFDAQVEMLKETLDNYPGEQLLVTNNLYKIEVGDQSIYWVGTEDASTVLLIVDTETDGNFCKISLTSKNPLLPKGSQPFASDIYLLIKKDIASANLVFSSDDLMTDDAFNVWQKLVSHGHTISVYNKQDKKYELTNINDEKELISYFGDNDKKKYVFVLSENSKAAFGLQHSIALLEVKKNAGYPLEELFNEYRKNIV